MDNSIHAYRTIRQVLSLTSALGLVVAATGAFALEPTPSEPTDTPPAVVGNQETPPATHIIIKYVDTESNRVQTLAGAQGAALELTQIAGATLEHVRIISGGAQVVRITGMEGLQSLQVTETVQSVIERINADPAVEYAEPDSFMQIQQAVDDPRYSDQWHYTLAGTGIDIETGWANSFGAGVIVAVIDTGSRPHVDLAANLLPGYDFITNTLVSNDGDGRDADASDPGDWVNAADTWCPIPPRDSSWHGTHVAGTVAAITNNATGVAGIARGASVVPVRVLGKCGGNLSDIADSIRWAAGLAVPGVPNNPNPAQVINMSLGGGGACGGTYQGAIDDAIAAGTSVIVSAGNTNSDSSGNRPGNCNGVVTVAATNRDGARSYYSAFGTQVEIAAPGGETPADVTDGVLSTLNAGTTVPAADSYAYYQGTSMAAPHVAGVAALLYQLDPGITPAEVSTTLQATAQAFPTVSSNQCTTTNCGAGILDAGAATAAITPPAAMAASMPWMKLLLKN